MPKFRITHSIEATITHEVEAVTAKEANGIAVGLTFERARQVHDANPDVDSGPVDDRWAKPVRLSSEPKDCASQTESEESA